MQKKQTLTHTHTHIKFRMIYTQSLVPDNRKFQILDEADCISHSTNTLGRGMNPIILPPAMGK